MCGRSIRLIELEVNEVTGGEINGKLWKITSDFSLNTYVEQTWNVSGGVTKREIKHLNETNFKRDTNEV